MKSLNKQFKKHTRTIQQYTTACGCRCSCNSSCLCYCTETYLYLGIKNNNASNHYYHFGYQAGITADNAKKGG